jgi:hypothetical protein
MTTRTEVNEPLSQIGSKIAGLEQAKTKCNFEVREFATDWSPNTGCFANRMGMNPHSRDSAMCWRFADYHPSEQSGATALPRMAGMRLYGEGLH